MTENYKVPVKFLKNKCDLNIFDYGTTEEIPALRELIGQERAMEALKFGLSVKRKGYNIYVSGTAGSGKKSYSYLIAKEFADKSKPSNDWCYVFNFNKPECPNAIRLEVGKGKIFKNNVEKAIVNIRTSIPEILSSKEYEESKNFIYAQFQKEAKEIIDELNDVAKNYSFVFKQTDKGILSIPLVDERPMTEEEIEKLTEEDVEKFKYLSNELGKKTFLFVKRIREIEDGLKQEIKCLKKRKVLEVVDFYINPLIEKFKQYEHVEEYFISMKNDIVQNFEIFCHNEKTVDNIVLATDKKEDFFKRYEVNLFIDNSKLKGSPVIKEMNPNYYNLFGKIEYINELGGLKTDHTRIKPGSMHEANGGYLIIQAKDILQSGIAWNGLKRAIFTQSIKIENITGLNIISETLRPEPIPLNVKVIIIGDYLTYHLLYQYDEDFKKLFKVRADFDVFIERNIENIKKISSFIAYQCKEQGLKPFDKSALEAIIELSSRFSENQNKLTAEFNQLVEIIYEADVWATKSNKNKVTRKDVQKAINKKIYRNNSYQQKLLEMIDKDILLINTSGWKIGQMNGLSVIDLGQYSFGRPNKITANTFASKDGIINIEREVNQSGNLHDKGILIISGYLGEKYAKNFYLSLTASITFEQSYSGIDGDSASSVELYVLLSNLSGLPINQGIAATGSVNQKGIIQPIGGVNEKIEGYFETCKIKGLKGGEGVIIPYKNIHNLMLKDEIIDAVEEGKFAIYAVKTIDEGMKILTDCPAGEMNKEGTYSKGTINYLVQRKLKYYSNLAKNYQ